MLKLIKLVLRLMDLIHLSVLGILNYARSMESNPTLPFCLPYLRFVYIFLVQRIYLLFLFKLNPSVNQLNFKVEVKKSRNHRCIMNLLLDRVKYDDFHPLLELCNEINTSEVEEIDLFVRSSCSLDDQYALSLIRSVNQKLRVVHLHDSFGKNFWR